MADNKVQAQEFLDKWRSGEIRFPAVTSGTTGPPKTIHLSREAMTLSAVMTGKALGITVEDRIFCCLPVSRVSGFMQLVRSEVWNTGITIAEPELNPFAEDVECSVTSVTPHQLHHILKNKVSRENLFKFRIVLIGGSGLDKSMEQKLKDKKPRFFHTYGMTETCSHIALRECNSDTYFKPFPGIEYSLNDNGCLKIRGAITDHKWLETRDLAQLMEDGFLITGRLDHVINSGGIKLQPEMIEDFLLDKTGLENEDLMIVGVPDEILGEKSVLVVKTASLHKIDIHQLIFPHKYWKPRQVINMDEFIFNESGKIDRMKMKNAVIHSGLV